MENFPARDDRVLQAVDFLKSEINAGRLVGALPGERELARRMRVSRETLRKALARLELEKWLAPVEMGKRRQVLKATKGERRDRSLQLTKKEVVVLSPVELEHLPITERHEHTRMVSLCSSQDIILRHRVLDTRHLKRPSHRLNEFIKQNPADLYLMRLASRETQLWFERQKIPAMVLGSCWPGVSLPSVDLDQRAIGVHLASTFARSNHHRVTMLLADPAPRGLELFIEGFEGAGVEISLTLLRHGDSPEAILQALDRFVREREAEESALILPRYSHILSIISLCAQRGLKVPKDLSVVCLTYDDSLQYIVPSIAAYNTSQDAFPKAAHRLITKILLHPEVKEIGNALIMPDFQVGASLV